MKKLQQKLSKVYLRQQAKGGIIDLEEEGKKMLVVTGGEESSSEFTELSPTDYQLGKKKLSFSFNSFNHNLFQDCVGIPCAPGPASLPTSPKKQQEQGGQGAGQRNGSWQGHAGCRNVFISFFSLVNRSRRRWEERGKSWGQRKRGH